MKTVERPALFDRLSAQVAAFPFHYGWVIAGTGLLTVLACLGIGRFSLGMLLPSMGATLGLSYAQMGYISSGNFIGYLFAVLACGRLVQALGVRRVIFLALLTIGATLILVSRSQGFLAVLLLYWITGMGSGAANVSAMGLVSQWFTRRLRGRAAGVMVSGSGLAIMGSGLLIPAINTHWGAEGWRHGWLILGSTVTAIALVCGALIRNAPSDLGLSPNGDDGKEPVTALGVPDASERRRLLAHLGAIYFLFGFTYVIYVSFIVTTLVKERHFSEGTAGGFWFWVGFLSLFSGPVFGALSDRLGRRIGLATVFALHCCAYLLVGLPLPDLTLYVSIALFGLAAWSVPSIIAAGVGDYVGPANAVATLGTLTFIFGLGQIAGPGLAGMLAEATQSFASSYLMAAALAGLAVVLSLLLTQPRPRPVT